MVCYGISGVVKSKKCLAYEGASNQPIPLPDIYNMFKDISLYLLYNTNISGIGWLVGGSFIGEAFLAINLTA